MEEFCQHSVLRKRTSNREEPHLVADSDLGPPLRRSTLLNTHVVPCQSNFEGLAANALACRFGDLPDSSRDLAIRSVFNGLGFDVLQTARKDETKWNANWASVSSTYEALSVLSDDHSVDKLLARLQCLSLDADDWPDVCIEIQLLAQLDNRAAVSFHLVARAAHTPKHGSVAFSLEHPDRLLWQRRAVLLEVLEAGFERNEFEFGRTRCLCQYTLCDWQHLAADSVSWNHAQLQRPAACRSGFREDRGGSGGHFAYAVGGIARSWEHESVE